ncbi:MAG: serine/threonine-protein kinase, partial [Flavihumibacter sp.]
EVHINDFDDMHLDADLPYIVMELIEGGDLRSRLKHGNALTIDETLVLAGQLVSALEAIHGKSVVHRDIKPENIMYRLLDDGSIEYLLTDFGIAKLREQSNTVTGSSMLTFEYASPEQFTDARSVGYATDYYSLGVVLFECITGRVPFEYEEGNLLLHINRVISHPADLSVFPGNGLPPSLKKLLLGLLAKPPGDRLTDPQQLRLLLQSARKELAAGPVIKTTRPAAVTAMPASLQVNRYGYETIMPAAVGRTVQLLLPARRRSLLFPVFVLVLLTALGMGIYLVWSNYLNAFNHTERYTSGSDSSAALQKPVASANPVNAQTVSYPVHPVKDQFFFDDFDDAASTRWNKGRDDQKEFALENGKYLIRGYDSNFTYQSTRHFNIDVNKDWSVSVTASRLSGSAPDGFGLNYLSDPDQETYFVFYISDDGFYKIEAKEHDNVRTLVDWTRTYSIHPGKASNLLSVEKKGAHLSFFINDEKVETIGYQGAFGNGFGLRVDGNQTVAFDQFILKSAQ